VTQELYQHLRAIIRTEIHTKIKAFEERLGSQSIHKTLLNQLFGKYEARDTHV
jgi:hypothetical protein